ncbi:GerW family sporulation protein [Marinicella sp. W31]|uniref:GerW family sporulation protein n=1 Tax=Marinicella sp. W31 TaxID=3023713 RepID=UPI0037567D45
MPDIEKLFDKAVGEIERILTTKTAVGEPIEVAGNTIIPLVNVGFGFGVGEGQGTDPKKGSDHHGGGTGGGGGVKPVALLIVNGDDVRVEPIKSTAATMIETVAKTIGKVKAEKNKKTDD